MNEENTPYSELIDSLSIYQAITDLIKNNYNTHSKMLYWLKNRFSSHQLERALQKMRRNGEICFRGNKWNIASDESPERQKDYRFYIFRKDENRQTDYEIRMVTLPAHMDPDEYRASIFESERLSGRKATSISWDLVNTQDNLTEENIVNAG